MNVLSVLLALSCVASCGPAQPHGYNEPAAPGEGPQDAAWKNSNQDAIWTASWASAVDPKFSAETPYDGDFYITPAGHLTANREQAVMSQPPLDGLPWELAVKISQPLGAGPVMVVAFVRCEPDGSFCAPVKGWESGLSGTLQSDSWPHCELGKKLSGGCIELQGSEGVASRLKYTPKLRISTQGQSVKIAELVISMSLRTMRTAVLPDEGRPGYDEEPVRQQDYQHPLVIPKTGWRRLEDERELARVAPSATGSL